MGHFLIQVSFSGKNNAELGMLARGFNPRLRKQKKEDLWEFQATVVYTVNVYRTTRTTQ